MLLDKKVNNFVIIRQTLMKSSLERQTFKKNVNNVQSNNFFFIHGLRLGYLNIERHCCQNQKDTICCHGNGYERWTKQLFTELWSTLKVLLILQTAFVERKKMYISNKKVIYKIYLYHNCKIDMQSIYTKGSKKLYAVIMLRFLYN